MAATSNDEDLSTQLSQQIIEGLEINNDTLTICANCGKESSLTMCNKCVTSLLMSEPLPTNAMGDSTDIDDSKEIATCADDNSRSNTSSICANCGKEGEEDNMNVCNKCKMAHYCNVACKKKHKSKHKKKCGRRLAELHDEQLFTEPPPREECPICFLPLPLLTQFKSCCGKLICEGCNVSMMMEDIKKGKEWEEFGMCPYCRAPAQVSDEENIKGIKSLMENGNADAFYELAGYCAQGIKGMPQNSAKANELWLKAGELGCAEAYYNLGNSYYHGRGVAIDKKKAKYYYELTAMMGNIYARYNLGVIEGNAGNHQRAFKHYILSARAGEKDSLDKVKDGFRNGQVTKDEYESTLRIFHESLMEMKSEARDAATRASERRHRPSLGIRVAPQHLIDRLRKLQ